MLADPPTAGAPGVRLGYAEGGPSPATANVGRVSHPASGWNMLKCSNLYALIRQSNVAAISDRGNGPNLRRPHF